MNAMQSARRLSFAALALATFALAAPIAAAEGLEKTDWSQHPGAAVAGAIGIGVAVLLAVAGIGCALATIGVILPSLRAAMDRHARASSPAWATVVGVLVGLGVAAAAGGAHHVGSHVVAGIVVLLLVVPAALLGLAGSLATVPLLGERLMGSKGLDASPLKRSVVGSVVLGLAILASSVVHPLGVLMVAGTLGWPLGIGVGALVGRVRRAPTAPVEAPPGSPSTS